jgi:hypothetical protein
MRQGQRERIADGGMVAWGRSAAACGCAPLAYVDPGVEELRPLAVEMDVVLDDAEISRRGGHLRQVEIRT